MARGFDLEIAAGALAESDPALGRWITRIGPIDMPDWHTPFDTVDALARSIAYQQLSGKAAATIVSRVEAAVGRPRLDAAALAGVDDAALRGCGLSANKTLALRDLCRHADAGGVPSARQFARLADVEIIERLIAVRGIGRWTVQMLLIFRLGRPDVLPVDDLAIRKGAAVLDGTAVLPTPKALMARGEAWAPWRTLASVYLWRIAGLSSSPAASTSATARS